MTKKDKVLQKKEVKKMFYGFFDAKDKMYITMDEFKTKHNFIPEQYKSNIRLMNAYKEYKRYGGWRKTPGAKFKVTRVIQHFLKNKIKNPEIQKDMTIEEKEAYFRKETKGIYAAVEKAEKELARMRNE